MFLIMLSLILIEVVTTKYVRRKIEKLRKRFNALKKTTRLYLERNKIPVKQVADALISAGDDLDEYKQFLENHSSILSHVSTHSQIFGVVKYKWNYISYKLLDHLIQRFIDDSSIAEEMMKYKADLQQFREKTPLIQFCLTEKESSVELPPNFQDIVAKFEWPDDVTLEVVDQFRKEYLPRYHLREVAVMLASVYIDSSGQVRMCALNYL